MCAEDKTDNLSTLLKNGYGAPPPREEFVRDLGERMHMAYDEQRGTPAGPQPQRVSAIRWSWVAAAAAAAAVVLLVAGGVTWTLTHPGGGTQSGGRVSGLPEAEPTGTIEEPLVPLDLKLPRAVVDRTPKNLKPSPQVEPYSDKPRPVFRVPAGTTNVALGKPVTASDAIPIIGELKFLTDGDKEGVDGCYVELGPRTQWVQIDLKEACAIYAILVWHYHGEMRVYHDTVIQVADDPDFIDNVKTVFNNDFDNSSGLGVGNDLEYIDDYRGRLIDAKGVAGRYVRLYSRGNSSDDQNHYIEVEVYGKPVGEAPAAAPAAKPAADKGGAQSSAAPAEQMAPLTVKTPHAVFN
jgi:hypothetical protein